MVVISIQLGSGWLELWFNELHQFDAVILLWDISRDVITVDLVKGKFWFIKNGANPLAQILLIQSLNASDGFSVYLCFLCVCCAVLLFLLFQQSQYVWLLLCFLSNRNTVSVLTSCCRLWRLTVSSLLCLAGSSCATNTFGLQGLVVYITKHMSWFSLTMRSLFRWATSLALKFNEIMNYDKNTVPQKINFHCYSLSWIYSLIIKPSKCNI